MIKTRKREKEIAVAEGNTKKQRPSSIGLAELESILGKVFTHHNCYSSPDVYQIVGWTKKTETGEAKRQIVIVRPVKFNSKDYPGGGNGTIDKSDIMKVESVVYNNQNNNYQKMTLKRFINWKEQEDVVITSREKSFQIENDLDRVYNWCEY